MVEEFGSKIRGLQIDRNIRGMTRYIYVLNGCLRVSRLCMNETANHTGIRSCDIHSGPSIVNDYLPVITTCSRVDRSTKIDLNREIVKPFDLY